MKRSPYSDLPAARFWKTAVAERHAEAEAALYRAKFALGSNWRIMTAGSCFAQHIARHLKARGYNVLDAEPPPPGLSLESARRYGFGMYSGRYGNIYLVRQLLQLAQEAYGAFSPADAVWERDGRYFDALRPAVEPNGFATAAEAVENRRSHLRSIRVLFETADLFVFTLGLTEGWQHTATGTVYPTAPGVIAGTYDPARHSFRNFTYGEIERDFEDFRALVRGTNDKARFLLTVSPVPLTATASQNHVLVATTYSKAVLRAVAGGLAARHDDIDYFPSFEIVANPWNRASYFEENLRSVTEAGVHAVMKIFFEAHGASGSLTRHDEAARAHADAWNDAACEEALLDAFAK